MRRVVWSEADRRRWLMSEVAQRAPEVLMSLGFRGEELKKLKELYLDRPDIWVTTGMPNALDFFKAAAAEGIRFDSVEKKEIQKQLFGGGEAPKKRAQQGLRRRRIASSFLDDCWAELEAYSVAAAGYYADMGSREYAFNVIVDRGEADGLTPTEVAMEAHQHYMDVVSGKVCDDKFTYGSPDPEEGLRYDDEFDDGEDLVGWDFIPESRRVRSSRYGSRRGVSSRRLRSSRYGSRRLF